VLLLGRSSAEIDPQRLGEVDHHPRALGLLGGGETLLRCIAFVQRYSRGDRAVVLVSGPDTKRQQNRPLCSG
jgi:hypothetical protein